MINQNYVTSDESTGKLWGSRYVAEAGYQRNSYWQNVVNLFCRPLLKLCPY